MAVLINKINLSDPFMKALKAVNSISNGATSLTPEDLAKQRAGMEKASRLATITASASTKPFIYNEMQCEWVSPVFAHNTKNVILYAHGGGYTAGGIAYARILASKMAQHTGLEVLSFEYRLAPENKYPAALEDGMAMWDYLMQLGYGARDVILAGDSAGGNLVLCMTQRIISENRIPPKALILYSPWTDMTANSETYERCKDDDPILSKDYVRIVRDAYIGADVDPSEPKYSPLFGDFTDFPPVLIQVGKNEILLDDSVSLAKKINKAGGSAKLMMYKDGWHVFQQMPVPLAGTAMNDVWDYLKKVLY